MSASAYPIFTVRGAAQELGRQHGEQAREQIAAFLEYLGHSLRLSRESIRQRAARFESLFRSQCGQLFAEVVGLAAGAKINLHDALAVQLRGELAGLSDGACTAFALSRSLTSSGRLYIGQNSDNPPELIDFAYVLRIVPDVGPRILIWTFGGMLGYHGFNEHGVAHFANALGGGPAWKFALSHYPLKRLLLEQRDLHGVRELMNRIPVCSNGNYVLCDGSGSVIDIELTSSGPFEIANPSPGLVVHSNHYLCPDFACNENLTLSVPDSVPRLCRFRKLVDEATFPLSLASLQNILRDHHGHPSSICRHSHHGEHHPMLASNGQTVASLIADPDDGVLYVAKGNPCTTAFVAYSLHE